MIGEMRLGRCINRGRCGLANQGDAIPVDPDARFICPECKAELIASVPRQKKVEPGEKKKNRPTLLLASAVLLTILIGVGIWFDLFDSFDITRAPALPAEGGTYLVGADAIVRVGTSTATFDALAPDLAWAFLRSEGCADIAEAPGDSRLTLQCGTPAHRKLTIAISAPDSIVNRAGKETRFLDVVITTDAPPARDPAAPDAPPVHARAIAVDALAVIVNPANPLTRLSQEQLASIFLGGTANFGAVGGPAGRIHVIAPTGTAVANDRLDAIVPQWLPVVPTASRLSTSAAIVDAVMADPLAIGLVDAASVRRAKALRIGPAAGVATPISRLSLVSGDYPLARPVTAVRFNFADSPIETAIVDFAVSPPGRKAITAAGFEPIRIERFKVAPPASGPPAYRGLVTRADRVAVRLRFVPDNLDFDPLTEADLDTLAARLTGEKIDGSRVIIVGLSDPAAGPAAAEADAAALARRVATALSERGVRAGETQSFGGAMPIAASTSAAARNHNRRVELWIRQP